MPEAATAVTFISFPARVEGGIGFLNAVEVTPAEVENEEVPAGCTVGGTEGSYAEPLAEPGFLCIYIGQGSATSSITVLKMNGELGLGNLGANPHGAALKASTTTGPLGIFGGTWAVTAP
jgi:hypothetical protein